MTREVGTSRGRRLSQVGSALTGIIPTVQVARDFGARTATKIGTTSRDMARLAEDLAKASGATVAHQLGSARDWGKELPGSMTGAVGLADRLYAQGKRAAADRRVQQVAATLATLAVTAVIRRHPAGALASSAWSMIEAIAQSDAFRRGRAAAPGWQGAVARAAGQHTWKRIGQKGGFATFTYVDVNGVVTERLVRDWRSTGRLIRGHCLLRNGYRSFRIDRIDDWNQPRQEGR